MKKWIAILLVNLVTITVGLGQSIHSLSFNNIDGGNVSLNTYQGFKTMFVIAPVSASDSNRLKQLKNFYVRYGDSIKIIGIMSIEDGYNSANNAAIKNLYDSNGININIVLTNGMYTKKAAGSSQSGLMKWLTEKDDNLRYDTDAKGLWDKYFVNKSGKLYGISGPGTSLLGGSVGWIVYREN